MTGPTQVLLWCVFIFVYGTVTLCGQTFQNVPLTTHNPTLESYNPERETLSVCPIPISLAATDGIDFSFSSSGYLDVSVHQVKTGIPGSSLVCQLPQAFRRLPRPCTQRQGIPHVPLVDWPTISRTQTNLHAPVARNKHTACFRDRRFNYLTISHGWNASIDLQIHASNRRDSAFAQNPIRFAILTGTYALAHTPVNAIPKNFVVAD